MAINRYLIAPIDAGIRTDLKPWLIPDQAFERLTNAYIFRGRVKKRFGSKLMSTTYQDYPYVSCCLGQKVGVLDGAGHIGPQVAPGTHWVPGQYFVVGPNASNEFTKFTITTTGVAPMESDLGAGTFDTATGTFTITYLAMNGRDVFYYPAEPVMGLITYETSDINNETTYAFDTQFAYRYSLGRWIRVGTATWTGNDAEIFWGTTYRGTDPSVGILFVTNNSSGDPIRYATGTTWTDFQPRYGSTANDIILTCRLIVSFKGRLLLFNTLESADVGGGAVISRHVNRLRYSLNGTALNYTDPDTGEYIYSFDSVIPGRGGYIDCPSREAIITCEFLKDRLIVFCEQSTWEVVYTGNEILPFVWQQIDTSLGAESTFSVVPFDKITIGIGNVGIHACNGANVERIDQNIPMEVFNIHNESDGPQRVVGIRDFDNELIYWSYPYMNSEAVYPNKILVYNYKAGTWAINEDSFTCFGYFQSDETPTWENSHFTWEEFTQNWSYEADAPLHRDIAAGNQQGWVVRLDSEEMMNAQSLHITNWVGNTMTIYNHNLPDGEFIRLARTDEIVSVKVIDKDTIETILVAPIPYRGNDTISRVSRIDILTKEYNFFSDKGRNSAVNRVDFYLTKASIGGEFAVDYNVSSSNLFLVDEAQASNALLGTNSVETSPNALIPIESTQDRIWRSVYLTSDGMTVQIRLYFSDSQMAVYETHENKFELHAMLFFASPTSMNMN